jgi:hypothetical protein
VPFEAGHAQKRWEDNFVVFAFKKNADKDTAKDDFEKLDIMFKELKYPIGFFININGYPNISLENYEGNYKNRIHELSNKMESSKLYIRHGYFKGGKLQIEDV